MKQKTKKNNTVSLKSVSALAIRNELVKDSKKKLVKQEMGPHPRCC